MKSSTSPERPDLLERLEIFELIVFSVCTALEESEVIPPPPPVEEGSCSPEEIDVRVLVRDSRWLELSVLKSKLERVSSPPLSWLICDSVTCDMMI